MGCFFIAEIGINHNGDLSLARKLIDVAKKAGCDAVKFQKRNIDLVYTQEFLASARESPWGKTQREQKEGIEFRVDDYAEIDKYCREVGIDWFASAWDVDSQRFMRKFDLKYNKVASPMLVYDELLREIASEKKYTFISTGMSEMGEIENAVKIFRAAGCPFELMHCVSTYPLPIEEANLACIPVMRDRFNVKVGYSGHEPGLLISYAAAALGISSLERHITMSRKLYGSDQSASIEPDELAVLVQSVREIQSALGDGVKRIKPSEIPVREKLRAHLPQLPQAAAE